MMPAERRQEGHLMLYVNMEEWTFCCGVPMIRREPLSKLRTESMDSRD